VNTTANLKYWIQKKIKIKKTNNVWLLTRRLAVYPMQLIRHTNTASFSIKPHIVVRVVTVWDKPLKHVVDVLICDDRQCGVQASTKLSRIIPTQHWIVCVETILLIVHWVALGVLRYHIYDVQQNQHTSCRMSTFIVTDFITSWLNYVNHVQSGDHRKGNELF